MEIRMQIIGIDKDFSRPPVWIDEEARRLWEPRLRTASALWTVLERASVIAGIRPGALITVPIKELVTVNQSILGTGLCVTAVEKLSPTLLRVAIHPFVARQDWFSAIQGRDDVAIGRLLGFPECCVEFFSDTWNTLNLRDTMVSMKEYSGPVNIFLRVLGIRLIPHLPCSAKCEASLRLQEQMQALAAELGMKWQLRWLKQVLEWPLEYTSYHGMAEIITPVFKFWMATDYSRHLMRIEREGRFVSVPAAWEDNGFSSPEVMEECHAVLGRRICETWRQGEWKRVVDLGCGDGALLNRLPDVIPCMGIDLDAGKINRGLERYTGLDLKVGKVEDFIPEEGDLCLVMPGRLPKSIPEAFLVYCYSDNVNTEQEFCTFCKKAGLVDPQNVLKEGNVICGVVRNG